MRARSLLILFIICLLGATALGQRRQSEPRFEDFRVPVYKGTRAPVKVWTRDARSFRTRLREGARQGVNFAGRYTVVTWGCGTGCAQVAIIDARTGDVYFPEELGGFGVWLWSDNDEALRFKPDSRLLLVSGFPVSETNKDDPKSGLYYYEWTGTRLRLVKFIEKKRDEGR